MDGADLLRGEETAATGKVGRAEYSACQANLFLLTLKSIVVIQFNSCLNNLKIRGSIDPKNIIE